MNIVVNKGPLHRPLLDTREASEVLVYDSAGQLVYFLLVMPGGMGAGSFLTCGADDPSFAQVALGAGLRLSRSE